MHVVLLIVSMLFSLATLVCWIFVIVEAFQNDTWAGVFCIVCGLYAIYYAIFEFDHDRKWLIVGGALGGTFLSALFYEFAMGVPLRPGAIIGPG